MDLKLFQIPISIAYTQTDVANFFNGITARGGLLLIKGPLAINSTGSPLDSVPARVKVIGMGEIDWTTSNSGATIFSMGADSVLENVYLRENNNYYYAHFKSDQLSWSRFWTNFPSQGGSITSVPSMTFDGNLNMESVGFIANCLLIVVTNASGTERARLEPGSAGNRGVVKLWDATLAAFRYAYIDNGAWVIAAAEPT